MRARDLCDGHEEWSLEIAAATAAAAAFESFARFESAVIARDFLSEPPPDGRLPRKETTARFESTRPRRRSLSV